MCNCKLVIFCCLSAVVCVAGLAAPAAGDNGYAPGLAAALGATRTVTTAEGPTVTTTVRGPAMTATVEGPCLG